MKTSFEECYSTTNETFKVSANSTTKAFNDSNLWFTIGIIIGVTIAVIIGVIVLVNRSNNDDRKPSPKANRNPSASIESQSTSKQSDTLDEIARNLKPGQKFRVLRFKSEVLEKEMLSPKKVNTK